MSNSSTLQYTMVFSHGCAPKILIQFFHIEGFNSQVVAPVWADTSYVSAHQIMRGFIQSGAKLANIKHFEGGSFITYEIRY